MKVLMTADAVGGVWTYALELANALARRGVAVSLATMGARLGEDQRRELRVSAVERVFESTFALEWMPEPWTDVARAGEWLLGVAADAGPDVVHLNGYAHAALPWPSRPLVAAHSDVLSWWQAVRREPAPPEWSRYRAAVEEGLCAAGLVVAPTRAMLSALERHYDFHTDRRVIPNGRGPQPRRQKEPYVAAAGRFWDEAKNLCALERAAPRLAWPIRYAGAAGRQPATEVQELLAGASIFAAPARYEPFGLGPLEAALAGCALVLGEIASLREVWCGAALYVDPENDDALTSALTRLVEDDALRAEYGERASARAREYTPERMADAYLEAYALLATEAVAA